MATVLLLLLALEGVDAGDMASSLASSAVIAPAAGFVVCLVAFVLVERRAKNPVFHLEYLSCGPIVITMVVSFFVGCMTITMTLIPEVAEFIMSAPVGSGGLYILPVGIMTMIGPPVGGKLIDTFGPKPVLMAGLAVAAGGFALLACAAGTGGGSAALLIVGLLVMGLGMGFSMGAPTNYMILQNTSPKESGSAIATIALVRQVGTTVAPALLLGFVTANPGAQGFCQMLLCASAFCLAAFGCTVPYRQK